MLIICETKNSRLLSYLHISVSRYIIFQARSTQMPRAYCLLHISGDCQSPLLFSLFLPIELLCRSPKEHIPTAVEGGFDGVLDDTDDETFFKLRKKKLSIFQI